MRYELERQLRALRRDLTMLAVICVVAVVVLIIVAAAR